MSALTKQSVVFPASAGPTFQAADVAGDTLKAGDKTYLIVKNGGGGSINVTIPGYPTTSRYGSAIPGLVVAVPAGGERWIGPLFGKQFRNPATDNVEVSYSGVGSVTVAAVNIQ